ncbi:MAG: lysophospholipid acyltransferase family protein [Sphingomicrobium sp.]
MASAATATVNAPSSRWRAYLRLAMLIGWFCLCIIPHQVAKLAGPSRWPRRFLRGVAFIVGADITRAGPHPGPCELLIGNHVSWLDVPVLAGATGCAFVSKAEIRDHWFLKWAADQNATLYVNRSDRRGIHQQTAAMSRALRRAQPLAIFPEGTVGDGGTLLPFKPSLLSAVAPPPKGVTLRPVAIDYNGYALLFVWAPGEHGLDNFLRILGRKGRIPVTVRVLDPMTGHCDRKALARAAHDAIAQALLPSGIKPASL